MKRFIKGVLCVSIALCLTVFNMEFSVKVHADNGTGATTETTTEVTTEQSVKKPAKEKKQTTDQGIKIQFGKKKKFTKKLKGSFVEKDGRTIFVPADKKTFKGGFFTVGKYVYHSDKKGVLDKGWKKIKGRYYHFDRKTGQMARSETVEEVKIGRLGTAKETASSVARINTYISARKIMEKVTNPTDSREDKLYKCFKWVESLQYKQYRTFAKAYEEFGDDWDVVFANDIFENKQGCCVSEAAAFAFLAKECGSDDVYVCSDSSHGWARIGDRLYDPLFAESKSFEANYNAPFADYRSNAAYKKKI